MLCVCIYLFIYIAPYGSRVQSYYFHQLPVNLSTCRRIKNRCFRSLLQFPQSPHLKHLAGSKFRWSREISEVASTILVCHPGLASDHILFYSDFVPPSTFFRIWLVYLSGCRYTSAKMFRLSRVKPPQNTVHTQICGGDLAHLQHTLQRHLIAMDDKGPAAQQPPSPAQHLNQLV